MKPKVLFLHQWKGPGGLYGGEKIPLRLFKSLLPVINPVVVLESDGEFADAVRGVPCEILVRSMGILRKKHLNPLGLLRLGIQTMDAAFWLARYIRQQNVRVVFSCSVAVTAGAFAAKLAKRPHVWLVQEVLSGVTTKLAPLVTAMSKQVITYSQAAAVSVHRGKPNAVKATRIAHPGIDVSRLEHGDREPLRRLYAPNQQILIGMIGRIHPWKGQDYFLDALNILRNRRVGPHRALIVGEVYPGNERLKEELKEKARRYGLQDTIVFTGQINEVENVFHAVDIVVAPSTLPEPFGLVVAEGMAARRPVISTNMGGPKEMIQDGVSGFLVPPNDPKLFADRLEALIKDAELRKRIGAAGRQRIESSFSEESFNQQIRELILSYAGASS